MLDEKLTQMCRERNFAALTTLFPDGHPQTQVMWVDCDEEHVIINTERHRVKFRNIERDRRVTVTIWDANDPYTYLEVRGIVVETVAGEDARIHINKLAQEYLGTDYPLAIESERVICKIAPERLAGYSA